MGMLPTLTREHMNRLPNVEAVLDAILRTFLLPFRSFLVSTRLSFLFFLPSFFPSVFPYVPPSFLPSILRFLYLFPSFLPSCVSLLTSFPSLSFLP